MLNRIEKWHALAVVMALLVGLVLVLLTLYKPVEGDESALNRPDQKFRRGYAPEKASFAVRFGEETSAYRVLGVFLLPGETLDLAAVPLRQAHRFRLRTEAGRVERQGPDRWRWQAPERKGVYPVEITDGRETITLNAFVMVPYDGTDELNGYRIGQYERKPLRNNPVYERPRGFIEVTPHNENTLVSPHFTLRQFVCKQTEGYPKYLVLRERLLLKLEAVLEAVNRQGIETTTFDVMSAYRTPFYNRSIGNETSYSAHLYGTAADIFVDRDRDGRMDDLTGDGRIDVADAGVLHRIVEELYGQPWFTPFTGGLGLYREAPHRGPFIHVDVRGERVRWEA